MADRDTISLQEVDPSPVEETPSGVNKDTSSYFPPHDDPSTASSTASHLGLSQHSTLWYLSRIQKYSTYAFTAFAAAHITNTSLIPLITRSVPASEPYLLLTRPYYQGLPAEPLLIIIPAWTHVLSGLAMRIYRRNLHAKRYGDDEARGKSSGFFSARFWPAVSGTSKLGFQLMPLLAGHVFINRVVPNQFPGGSSNVNLSYVAHAFATHPAVSFAGFSALLVVGCWHISWGWAKWLGYTPNQVTTMGPERELRKKRRWYIVNAVAAALTGLWVSGSFGVVARAGAASGWAARQYEEMYRSIPLIGRWV